MAKKKVYTIGETILDIIFDSNMSVIAKAGGSMLNTAVSLSRAAIAVEFISETGCDHAGQYIKSFIESEGISSKHLKLFTNGQTPVALAFLDENKNAHYSFYKNYPEERLQIQIPEIKSNDVLLFGSSFALNKQLRDMLKKILIIAQKNKATIVYDPNYRKKTNHELAEHISFVKENMSFATIVRGSNEDFYHLFGVETAENAYNCIKPFCKNLIYTHSDVDVHLFANGLHKKYFPPKIELKSSIGAGDSFNAGLIYTLIQFQTPFSKLNSAEFDTIINNSMKFAVNVCTSKSNYISKKFASKL